MSDTQPELTANAAGRTDQTSAEALTAEGPTVANGPPESSQEDRRRRNRRSYPYRQYIAPIIRNRLPAKTQFATVCCNDISAGGFSYLAGEPPASNRLLVGLGEPPDLTYVVAEVVHVTRVTRGEKQTYTVGCRYTGRAEY